MNSMNLREKVILKALIRADDEANKGRNVIVLFPCQKEYWGSVCQQVGHCYWMSSPAGYANNPRNGVYIRYSTFPSSLRVLQADVLIVVDPDNEDWNEDALLLARERLRGSVVKLEVSIRKDK